MFREVDVPNFYINNVRIPRGTWINAMIMDIHHNEKYWPLPKEFIPERFLVNYCINIS